LQHGAIKVYALDVGENQLDWKMRTDSRVVVLERCNAREIEKIPKTLFSPRPELVTVDLSFISSRMVLKGIIATVVERGALILVLVKPQFELPRQEVSKGGVVRDQQLHKKACSLVANEAASFGLIVSEPFASPVTGKKARNQEFFLLFFVPPAS